MSNIEKLLEGVEVEWKTLGEIGEVGMCKRILKEQTSDTGDIPFYKIGTFGKEPNAYISKELFDEYKSKYSYPKIGEVLISASGTIGRAVIFDGKDAYFQDSNIVWIKNDESQVLNRYLFYVYQIAKWGVSEGGTIQRLYNDNLKKTIIPIPSPENPEKSLEIQQEIVRILDKFSTLTAELQAELQARKSQYEYYRNQLLTYPMEESDQLSLRSSRSATSIQSSDSPTQPLSTLNPHTGNSVLQPRGKVEWETLEEIFNLKNGYTPSKSNQEYWENGTIPWFRMEDIRENGRVLNKSIQYVNSCAVKGDKLFPANSIIIATSATIGEHALITVPFLSNQRFTNLSLKREYADKFIIKFLFYYSFVLGEWCKKNITVGNFAGVDMIGFKKFLIPIPPLEEQERIVSILDKFDTLTTSITDGLPKEIKLRQKQYEYYRDMLLTFPTNNIKA